MMDNYELKRAIRKAFDKCMSMRLDALAAQRELDVLIREADARDMQWNDDQ